MIEEIQKLANVSRIVGENAFYVGGRSMSAV
jgi:hypothetical protein